MLLTQCAEVKFDVDGKFVQEFITNPLLLGGRSEVTWVGVAGHMTLVSTAGSLTLECTQPSPPLTL